MAMKFAYAAILLLGISGACSDERPPTAYESLPTPMPVGTHLRFHSDAGSVACGGTLRYIDDYIGELKTIHEVPDDWVVDYYWYPNDEGFTREVCENTQACATEFGEVITTLIPHEHEIVHAVRAEFGLSHLFFEEGAAELWAGHYEVGPGELMGVREALGAASQQDVFGTGYYRTAGRFSSYIAGRFGPEALVRAARRTAFVTDAEPLGAASQIEAVDDALAAELGASLGELVEEFEAEEWACGRETFRDDTLACVLARPISCDDDGIARVSFAVSCASEDFVGPRGGRMWAEATIELEENRVAFVTVNDPDDVVLAATSQPCRPGCDGRPRPVSPNIETERILEVGRHLFRVEVDPAATADQVTIQVSNVCP